MTVGLVSCTRSKSTEPKPPKELYVESVLFQKARRYCEVFHDDWYILSAKHKLLAPDGPEIAPYNLSLSDFSVEERREWGATVAEELRDRNLVDELLVVHAGKDYYEPLLNALGEVKHEIPTEGLRYGESLSWYNEQFEDA